MPNPAHHHCHPFTDSYKGLTCAEPKPFLTARKSDTPILWRACLLVVPAGLNPRTYSIGTLQPCQTCQNGSERIKTKKLQNQNKKMQVSCSGNNVFGFRDHSRKHSDGNV